MADPDLVLYGRPLTVAEFNAILLKIQEDHHDFHGFWKRDSAKPGPRPKMIKYVYPCLDLRDRKVFRVTFDRLAFDFRDSDRPMYDRILEWLDADEQGLASTQPVPSTVDRAREVLLAQLNALGGVPGKGVAPAIRQALKDAILAVEEVLRTRRDPEPFE